MDNDNPVIDNSDLDLTGVALRDPIIDKQWVRSRITGLRWEQLTSNKTSDGKAVQLIIEAVTEEPATATDGRVVPVGHKSRINIFGTPTGGLTQDMINKRVGRFQVAALGLSEPVKFGSPEQYIGKLVKGYYEAEADKKDASILYQRINRWEKV